MAFTRDDRRIIIFTGALVVIAALFFVSVLVFATGGSTPSKKNQGPLYLGEVSGLRAALNEGSPLYFANPFGGPGFWLDREQGAFVALDVRVPNSQSQMMRLLPKLVLDSAKSAEWCQRCRSAVAKM